MSTKPVHCDNPYFQFSNGELLIGGKTARQLAATAMQTPLYVYDRSVIQQKVEQFRAHIPSRIALHYAMKANPMPAVVDFMAHRVDGLDVASGIELRTALNSGMPPSRISFAGPAKSIAELRAAVAANITINVESELELSRIYDIAHTTGITPRVAFRVNPDFELKASGMKMSGGPKQFGIDAEKMPGVLQNLDNDLVEFVGFHIFSGSQNLKAEALIEAHDKTFALAAKLAELCPNGIKKLNIGGGFGIPYFPGETHLPLEPIGQNLERLLAEYEQFSETEIQIELGRYLVGECGVYLCEITDIKESREQTYYLTNGGLHHHLSNSGNFGQVIRKNYPVVVATNTANHENITANVVGPLCTPLDIVADKMTLPKASVGDLIAVFQSGAYGASASPKGFLSHPDVVELLV